MSTRQNQDFLNPTPNKSKPTWAKQKDVKHGNLGHQLDNMDEYADAEDDHTKQYFNGKKGEFGEQLGDRRFKPNIADLMGELDQKIYGGEVTSRKQRDQSDSEAEEGEDEGDESGEEMEEDSESNADEEEDKEQTKNNAKKSDTEDVITKLTKGKNDNEVDQILNKLKDEDKVNKYQNDYRQVSDTQKAKSVKVQKKICDQALQQRILLQKPMGAVAKFPNEDFFSNIQNDTELSSKIQTCKRKTKQQIKNLAQIQKDLFQLSETTMKIKVPSFEDDDTADSVDSDKLWSNIEQNLNKTLPFLEDTINRWNERNQTAQVSKKGALNKTIIDQVKQTLNDTDLKGKAIKKTQYKRATYRVLGANGSGINDEYDSNLFNDYDLYQTMLSDFLNQNDKNDDSVDNNIAGAGGGGDNEFLYGADLSMTQKYLLKRQKLKELAAEKKKNVDCKASKGRKIRYVVHDKLQSFMTPMENLNPLESKAILMNNLFGQNQNAVPEKQTKVSSKRHKKDENSTQVMLL